MPEPIDRQENSYGGSGMPLAQYGAILSVFWTLLGAVVGIFALKRRANSRLETFGDILLVGFATHKLSRLATKDRVTSVLRAPFAKYVEDGSPGEVEEESRGSGMRKAIGDLITCPYCLSPWIATVLATGLVIAPNITRRICGLFSSVAIAHFLHQAYTISDNARKKE